MDRESMERLRFDRRLMRRRDWLSEGDYESHLEALPDVSDKVATGAEDEEREAPERAVAGAAGEPAASPSSAAGSFSSPEFPNPEGSSTPS